MPREKLIEELRLLLGADVARISAPRGRMYLILGTRRRSIGKWTKNGKPINFDYLAEKVVASGNTAKELRASAAEYKRLCGLTMVEYLAEKVAEARA